MKKSEKESLSVSEVEEVVIYRRIVQSLQLILTLRSCRRERRRNNLEEVRIVRERVSVSAIFLRNQ